MEKINIIICDIDQQYAEILCSKLSLKYSNMSITVISPNQLQKQINENVNFNLILIHESLKDIDLIQAIKWSKVFLTENISYSQDQIFKYQSYEQIAKGIRFHCEGKVSNALEPQCRGEIIVIFGEAIGCGKTTVSRGIAKCFARKGKKVFYMNLETKPTRTFLDDRKLEERESAEKFIYHMLYNHGEKALQEAGHCVIKDFDGVDVFYMEKERNPFLELEVEELAIIMGKKDFWWLYDVICIDLSSGMSPINRFFLKWCSKLILICDEEGNESTRQKFQDMWIVGEIITVNNKIRNDKNIATNFSLPYDEQVITDSWNAAILNTKLGEELEKLSNYLER